MSTRTAGRQRSSRPSMGWGYLFLSAVAAAVLLPFVWTIYASFIRDDNDVSRFPTDPAAYGLDNYSFVLGHVEVARWYANSILVTGIILAANLLLNTAAGYALARVRFPGRSLLFGVVLATMMIPPQVLFVPVYLLVNDLGWLNTYAALTIPFLVNPFGAFLMRQYFLSFPSDLEEACRLDGLTHIGIFFRIALPLSLPALATQAILVFVWNWNTFVFPSVLVSRPEMYTLPVGIFQITHTSFSNHLTAGMAGVVLMTIPTVLVFAGLQRHVVRSIAGTGLRG
jgi:multiple sugar transport system permease protein